MAGTLRVVSVPIGNMGDITLRAIQTLKSADAILCEDLKPARRLLHELSRIFKEESTANGAAERIEKQLIPLNEHTEADATAEAMTLLRSGKDLALISDAGTPLIADPGQRLVLQAIEEGIEVLPVPGASSILAGLVVSGFRSDRFYFAGMLPRDKSERKNAARKLAMRDETIVLLEAPYRLPQVLDDLLFGFGNDRLAAIAMDISMPKERVARGTLLALRDLFKAHPFKGEFVVIIEGRLP